MSTLDPVSPVITVDTSRAVPRSRRTARPIPLTRIVAVELRKSFDTRSGLALLVGIGAAALLATGAVMAWAPREQFTYSQFTLATAIPMSIILPVIAVLSVTSEWSQRTGLATFTLVPHRGRVMLAKALGLTLVGVLSTAVAFAVGALGNLAGAAIAGIDPVWDRTLTDVAAGAAGNTLLLLVGFTLGVLIRSSPGAVVAYMVYAFVAPSLFALLAFSQGWFDDIRPWVDAKLAQDALLQGVPAGEQWAHLVATTGLWLVAPLTVGVLRLRRSEVK